MTTEAEVLPPVTDIILAVEESPQIVLLDQKKFNEFYEKIKAETDTLVPDVSTKKGRDEIRSMASRVVTTKTSIEKARLDLTKQWRDQTATVNAAGKEIEQSLSGLAAEVRAPLTKWEDRQKEIERQCRETMDFLRNAAIITLGDTVEVVRERGTKVFMTELDEEVFGSLFDDAQTLKGISMVALKEALARLEKEEADRAELARLKEAEEKRLADEEAKREAEAAQKAEEERKEREEQERAAAEKVHAEAVQRAQEEAAEKARVAAEQEAQRKIDEANERAAQAERAAQEERDRIAAAEAAKEAEEKAERDAQAKRDADQAHRTAVKTKAKEAIMTCGVDEEAAKKVVMAIIAGEVPYVILKF